jgi:UDP:flavonoid glycosyltransferase YjiC (YdhE family)
VVGRQLRRAARRAARWNIARFFDPPVNATRSAVGLPPVHDALFLPIASGNAYLVGASRHVVAAPPDWPSNVQLTGFFAWDRPRSLQPPVELEAFLSEGPAPVLITLGGSSAVDPQGFYPAAVAAVRSLGLRALVLAGPTPAPFRPDPDPQVFACPFAPLSKVAARCTAAIHHGGIGTTVALLAAGLPQLIVPRGFDQPQTALRMERVGVAVTLPWKRATSPMLRRRLEKLLGTNEYRRQASMLSRAVQEEDGLRRATDEIERLILT